MKNQISTMSWINQMDFSYLWKSLDLILIQPFIEVYRTAIYRSTPLVYCAIISCVLQAMLFFKLDFYLFKFIKIGFLYPKKIMFLRWSYLLLVSGCSFYFWGAYQLILRLRLTRWLTDVFQNANLKSSSGKYPGFIYDKPIDKELRILRLKKNGTLFTQYESKALGGLLQVEIDHIKDDVKGGAVDIYYANSSLEEKVEFPGVTDLKADQFYIGKGRSSFILGDLKTSPHYLIGGTTGSGKSCFFNQIITSLYLKNTHYTFHLIDLKFGSEFESKFAKLPRVTTYSDTSSAANFLSQIVREEIRARAEFLKLNDCQNIDELLQKKGSEIKTDPKLKVNKKFGRKIIVIDEAHSLFLKSDNNKANDVTKAKASVINITALGRSVGVHVFIGTQRPDAKAIDPLIKANLSTRICFYSANNATSMTILDNTRGHHLNDIKGRCIWQSGIENRELQSPYLPKEKITEYLSEFYVNKPLEVKSEESTNDDVPEDLNVKSKGK